MSEYYFADKWNPNVSDYLHLLCRKSCKKKLVMIDVLKCTNLKVLLTHPKKDVVVVSLYLVLDTALSLKIMIFVCESIINIFNDWSFLEKFIDPNSILKNK